MKTVRNDKKATAKPRSKTRKYIFVVGGVMSGVGKGVASSSIAMLLQARGYTVTAMKIDPYINVDAGTMNPTEHGEVFVLKEGLETDQDMGNYERFLGKDIPDINYMTTGSVYQDVIRKERNLEYKGKNVEVVPHIPLEVISRIERAGEKSDADITIIEIGGTVGEYQNILFLEAVRMMKSRTPADVLTVMVSYLPVPGSIGEMKTKPTQNAVRLLNSAGVFADFILARAPITIDKKRKEKISQFCNVPEDHVISAPDVESVYDVPLNFEKDNLSKLILNALSLSPTRPANVSAWRAFVKRGKEAQREVKIAVVGKYFNSGDFILSDVYLSVLEALKYSAYQEELHPVLTYLSSETFVDARSLRKLKEFDGILVPGGFGKTGIEGKLKVIEYARKEKIPYFGICYGMQLMVLEFAKNVARIKNASTEEINPAGALVVGILEGQKEKIAQGKMGGSMRLGEYPCLIKKGSVAHRAYGKSEIGERHRHRYEVNPLYVSKLEEKGLVFSGTSPDNALMEIAELPKEVHPFFLGTQFHPEFKARPLSPHPLFSAFVRASYEHRT